MGIKSIAADPQLTPRPARIYAITPIFGTSRFLAEVSATHYSSSGRRYPHYSGPFENSEAEKDPPTCHTDRHPQDRACAPLFVPLKNRRPHGASNTALCSLFSSRFFPSVSSLIPSRPVFVPSVSFRKLPRPICLIVQGF